MTKTTITATITFTSAVADATAQDYTNSIATALDAILGRTGNGASGGPNPTTSLTIVQG